jgi:hypothetical protein
MAPPHTLLSQYENRAVKGVLLRQEDAVTFVQTAVPDRKETLLVTGCAEWHLAEQRFAPIWNDR